MNYKAWKHTGIPLAALILIWGLSWIVYKSALTDNPPLLFSGLRSIAGGIVMTLYLLPAIREVRWRKNAKRYLISTLISVVMFFGFQAFGLLYLPGGLFSVLVYLQPILLSIFAWMWFGERMTWLKFAGLLSGFGGIAVISADSFTGDISLTGVLLGVGTALAWALGTIYVKKESSHVDPLWMVAIPNLIGGAVLTGIGAVTEGFGSIRWNAEFIIGLAFGAFLATSLAFAIYYKLVSRGEASRVAAFTFLVPMVSVVSGTLLLNEPITLTLIAGLAMIVLSIVLVNRPQRPVRQEAGQQVPGSFTGS
mgnify:CR=1 FL=1